MQSGKPHNLRFLCARSRLSLHLHLLLKHPHALFQPLLRHSAGRLHALARSNLARAARVRSSSSAFGSHAPLGLSGNAGLSVGQRALRLCILLRCRPHLRRKRDAYTRRNMWGKGHK